MILFLWIYPPHLEEGPATFHIEEVKRHAGPIQTSIVYIGKIQGKTCHIYFHPKQKRPPANVSYHISYGTPVKMGLGRYFFKPAKGATWTPLSQSSLAEWRFQTKEKVRRWIHSRFKKREVAHLMTALATGNLESRLLAYQFRVVGLSHLLAISGFHFALLTFFLSTLLKRFLPERILAAVLIVLLGAYFFYMGGAPSINRAWIGVLIYLVGILLGYRPTPLNTLGVALLFALIGDPLIVANVGFQLSFGATLGIILFYLPFEQRLRKLFPKRPYKELLKMKVLDQCGYLVCTYLRKVIALQGAVLTLTLPLALIHFGSYPLMAPIYNLFCPFLFTALLASFLLHLDFLTAPFASFLISLIAEAPKRYLFEMRGSGWALACLVLALAIMSTIKSATNLSFDIHFRKGNQSF
ncbi:ComEC/Rec2 family competence protein [Candidatus Neptunochlamydia vexilliferae]|uniref:ComEC/Rec2-related protein domain-containing protein n=1 Tax=Candidatus Neptunichlamydia vexilliferae TaxID=1651774 RepID=A0ABS0B0H6_9BACT|nr:ComEC/Rec2 family competence protein [Candidatus Neptunochlamydia vexilliferae]MBF5059897.1 hypothetical protein [Candidatus Neptunochlamydia vexilliferae]